MVDGLLGKFRKMRFDKTILVIGFGSIGKRHTKNILEQTNSQIITIAPDILGKIKFLNKDLKEFSLETVKDFYRDAKSAGFKLSK